MNRWNVSEWMESLSSIAVTEDDSSGNPEIGISTSAYTLLSVKQAEILLMSDRNKDAEAMSESEMRGGHTHAP